MKIQVPQPVLDQLLQIFKEVIGDRDGVEVILFGSRATNQYRPDSDVDLAVKGLSSNDQTFNELEHAIQRSQFPVEIELINEDNATLHTLDRVKKEGICIWPER